MIGESSQGSSLEAVDMKTAGCIELAELEAALQKWHVGTSANILWA